MAGKQMNIEAYYMRMTGRERVRAKWRERKQERKEAQQKKKRAFCKGITDRTSSLIETVRN